MRVFGIVRVRDLWVITSDGRRWGSFDYRVDAEEAALRLARQARDEGASVEVLAQEQWGEIRALEHA